MYNKTLIYLVLIISISIVSFEMLKLHYKMELCKTLNETERATINYYLDN